MRPASLALPPELCGWKGNRVNGIRRNLPSEVGVGSEEVESLLDHASNQGNWLWAVLGWRLFSWEAAHLCPESVLGQSHFPELLCILTCLLTSDLPPTSPSLSHATPPLYCQPLLPTQGAGPGLRTVKPLVSCCHGSRSAGCQSQGRRTKEVCSTTFAQNIRKPLA